MLLGAWHNLVRAFRRFLVEGQSIVYTTTHESELAELASMRVVVARMNGVALLEGVDWDVQWGQHWLVTGPNGAGKSPWTAPARTGGPGQAAALGRADAGAWCQRPRTGGCGVGASIGWE